MSAEVKLAPCPYKLGKELGEGSYAIVKEAYHIPTNTKYAAKVFNKKLIKGKQHVILNEINILKQLSKCPDCILKLVDYFESVNNLYVIMDLAAEDLFDKMMRGVTEEETKTTLKRVLSALEFLHQHKITHRDLKPENILLRSFDKCETAMVGDFGLAKLITIDESMRTLCGTPGYLAPEVLNRKNYTNAVDIWSVGCIAYFMLTGTPPFEKPSTLEELEAILAVDVFIPDTITEEGQHFIKNCLRRAPEQRFNVHECQSHTYLNEKSIDNATIVAERSKKRWKKAIDAVKFIKLINESQKHKKMDESKMLIDIPAPVQEDIIEMIAK